jgi:tryptophan synthase alpha chain
MNKMNALTALLERKQEKLLSVYFTAGFPEYGSTVPILQALEKGGVDFAEVGMPFSDPLADGPVIQQSSTRAIRNGMDIGNMLAQLAGASVSMPIVLMGYLNPVLQYGLEAFCRDAAKVGVSGLILPDLPPEVYVSDYKNLFGDYGLHHIFLVTPTTNDERIRLIDDMSTAFIYAVSASSVTGSKAGDREGTRAYLKRLGEMNLKHPFIVGFGIQDRESLSLANAYGAGAIVGTAFIRALQETGNEKLAVDALMKLLDS